ncbi:hypothetical protein Poli38472_007418 [Pythium oligandrum]|uniref:RanBP-type and C3HC4-type zinc finger-containing protein 1 n=1 Tax=Pythium oligandrum TaxID=41045 RepID=A0A8K1CQ45_PYTOL|nr:hypothetical protein Poli38472_007418 [Pythium oligandrum]|eukprot:TMW67746.1 hypothetical protein Poli38472_007418 [Pythium oligandrum]
MAATRWSCARCTFENEPNATQCIVCMHRPVKELSNEPSVGARSAKTPTPPKKKARGTPPNTGKGKQQSLLMSVGSSKEQEAKRLEKKVQQMRELGIDLPRDDVLALLARNVYCVHVAASEYFERMAAMDAAQNASDATQNESVADAVQYFETRFLGAPYRLLGRTAMKGSITRAGARLAVGDRLLFQGENVGMKRGRGMAAPAASKPVASSSPSAAPPTTPSATAMGIVRILTMDNMPLGRLDRETEITFHPLLKEGLISLGGVCYDAPSSTDVFASFQIFVFVYVHPKAFEIFDEDHALFHLSDPLYSVLESIHSGAGDKTSLTSSLTSENQAPRDLDALFSAFAGSIDNTDDEKDDPAQELVQHLNGIELRSHQKQALSWMIWRETQAEVKAASSPPKSAMASANEDINPLWEKRYFQSQRTYFINPFEKIASLEPPAPPSPCLGGILADDMGMGKTMMLLSLIAHRKLYRSGTAGDTGSKTQRRGKTLIICPLSLLHQWKDEVHNRFKPQTLSVLVYYGDERETASFSIKSDIVLTTYGVLSSEFEKQKNGSSVLLGTEWDRVILDEAHSIKNRATTYFRACAALQAVHRWCLTGTPIQNSLSDLFSLLCFLRYEPWSRVAWWKRVIANPFEQGDDQALVRLKVILTPILLRRTKHSRDAHGKNIVELPPKHIEIAKLQFTEEEREFYQAVYDRSRAEFNGYVSSGAGMSSYIAIFALLLRLRQACDHPFLALGRNSEQAAAGDAIASENGKPTNSLLLQRETGETIESYFHRISKQLQKETSSGKIEAKKNTATENGSSTTSAYIQNVLTQIQEEGLDAQECPVCLDPPRHGVLTPCAHLLCEDCLRESLSNDPEGGCPVCRVPVEMSKVYSLAGIEAANAASQASVEATDNQESATVTSGNAELFLSTKLRRLIKDLCAIRDDNSRAADPAERRKIVIFSQWTHMLEMVADVLTHHKFRHCMFHGGMTQETRERVLHKFASDPETDVLVISLKAGGVGLNLTSASVVILLDPWWNPGVEDQAIDRVHRLGQTRDVIVKRYVVEDTVEDMILQLQQRKEKLAKNVLVAAKSAEDKNSERLSMEDLLAFFK